MEMRDLTQAQRAALIFLAKLPFATPAYVGAEIMRGRETRTHRSEQGYGRIGGGVCSRLVKLGLAYSSSARGGFPCYALTTAARALVKEGETR